MLSGFMHHKAYAKSSPADTKYTSTSFCLSTRCNILIYIMYIRSTCKAALYNYIIRSAFWYFADSHHTILV